MLRYVIACQRASANRFVLLTLGIACISFTAWGQDEKVDPMSFDRSIEPLLQRFCYRCHQADKSNGDVDLKSDNNLRLIAENEAKWQMVADAIRDEAMPPDDAKQPSDEERQLILQFIDKTLHAVDCSTVKDPGPALVRRLNRAEYDNSIQMLTGLDLRLSENFAADSSSYGFANNAAALTLTPVQVEQYYDAADKVVERLKAAKAGDSTKVKTQLFGGLAELNASEQTRQEVTKRIRAFAGRAFRRPVEDEWLQQLLKVYDHSLTAGQNAEQAMGHLVTAILISPHFLLRSEPAKPEHDDQPFAVSDLELASRLSFFLWSAPPDDELLKLAAKQTLHEPTVLHEQVERMLKHPRSDGLIENFFSPWLQINDLDSHKPDPSTFPRFNERLATAIADEPRWFLRDLIRENRSILNLIDSDYAFVNETLAVHYQLPAVDGEQMQRVGLSDKRRGGLFTSAAILMVQSDPARTNIPRRGSYLSATVLNAPPPAPPPNVPKLEEAADAAKPMTLRERFEQHRSQAACASCHAKIDPLGFALENYDAIGAWRDQDSGLAIDASGEMPDGTRFNGPEQMKHALLERKEAFAKGFATHLLIFALGRSPVPADQCVIDDMLKRASEDQWRFQSLVHALVDSYPFRYRRNADF